MQENNWVLFGSWCICNLYNSLVASVPLVHYDRHLAETASIHQKMSHLIAGHVQDLGAQCSKASFPIQVNEIKTENAAKFYIRKTIKYHYWVINEDKNETFLTT